MPTGYRAPRELRWLFFDLVCSGTSVWEAERQLGVSRNVGAAWWRKAGAMKVQIGGRGRRGLLQPGNMSLPGGRGHRLSVEERVEIMRARDAGLSDAEIAERLDRDRSTIYRETRRNRNADGDYHALMAHARAAEKARRPKNFKLIDNPLCAAIEAWMDQGWSPKLIADVLARDHRDDKLATVSHETIYQCLYVQTRGSLRADLHRCLSTKRSARKSRGHVDSRSGVYSSGEEFTIAERAAEAEDRAVPGHWEGDLIVGPNNSAIGTLVERTTRFTLLLHLPGDHTAETVSTAMIAAMSQLPEHLRRSITWDRGSEMARWKDIHLQLKTPVYFCNPHSPWQRGTNENTNRLLRFWFEKGSDLSGYTPADLKRIQDTLNRRPRPTLDLDTPAQRLAALLEQAA
ncbi:integrase [Mycobacterium saskatchewanense]|uniref:Integrase n=1 Tax=Mycobacterium saskatchewanense TaxID=220927 RepID=A0AAJ3TTY0_9MYCO|nr:IS30 family transposase [Mycobacterium saskatchewanense]ORW69451.1 integrase [Mycobacterium saskatchewanense]